MEVNGQLHASATLAREIPVSQWIGGGRYNFFVQNFTEISSVSNFRTFFSRTPYTQFLLQQLT